MRKRWIALVLVLALIAAMGYAGWRVWPGLR